MTDREKAIVMAYTGICMLTENKFQIFHQYVEDIMGRPVQTIEMGIGSVADEIKEKARPDFLKLCEEDLEPCGDCVSRDAVLDLVADYDLSMGQVVKGIHALPTVTLQPCEDAISRQAVDDAIYDYSRSCDVNYEQIMEFIDKLPSVTPQQKMGKWSIKRIENYDHAICSICGDDSYLSPEWDAVELYKYCPNCGSYNGGEG